jgi:hypothetical protein
LPLPHGHGQQVVFVLGLATRADASGDGDVVIDDVRNGERSDTSPAGKFGVACDALRGVDAVCGAISSTDQGAEHLAGPSITCERVRRERDLILGKDDGRLDGAAPG